MEEMFTPKGPEGQEETVEDQTLMRSKAGIFQSLRRWSERLPRVRHRLVELFISLGLFLLLVTVLVQLSRIHQTLHSRPGVYQSAAAAPQKQVLGALDEMSRQLAQMNVTLGSLCRPCPWGWELFQGSCYWFSRFLSNWKSAESTCQHRNAHLVIINSDSEEKFLESWEVRHEKRTWIGLSDQHNEATWQWVDGTPLQLSYWKPGEPNNDENEDCAELYNDGWNDDQCKREKVWICEKPSAPCASLC